jgi:hypothetical protein
MEQEENRRTALYYNAVCKRISQEGEVSRKRMFVIIDEANKAFGLRKITNSGKYYQIIGLLQKRYSVSEKKVINPERGKLGQRNMMSVYSIGTYVVPEEKEKSSTSKTKKIKGRGRGNHIPTDEEIKKVMILLAEAKKDQHSRISLSRMGKILGKNNMTISKFDTVIKGVKARTGIEIKYISSNRDGFVDIMNCSIVHHNISEKYREFIGETAPVQQEEKKEIKIVRKEVSNISESDKYLLFIIGGLLLSSSRYESVDNLLKSVRETCFKPEFDRVDYKKLVTLANLYPDVFSMDSCRKIIGLVKYQKEGHNLIERFNPFNKLEEVGIIYKDHNFVEELGKIFPIEEDNTALGLVNFDIDSSYISFSSLSILVGKYRKQVEIVSTSLRKRIDSEINLSEKISRYWREETILGLTLDSSQVKNEKAMLTIEKEFSTVDK